MEKTREVLHLKSMQRLQTLSGLLDSWFVIPGTRIRFGFDALLGLIPVAGDVVSLLVSLVIFREALSQRVSRKILLRMLGNFVFDAVLGSIPIAGDVFDVFSRVNLKNFNLLLNEVGLTAEDLVSPEFRNSN
ncbi:DUF4112 domain-containing protein [bacterium]|nr:DUF4112 domain-containing protein [bacterium]